MRVNRWGFIFILCSVDNWSIGAENSEELKPDIPGWRIVYSGGPNYKKYPVEVSKGPFTKKLQLTEKEGKNSAEWKKNTTRIK